MALERRAYSARALLAAAQSGDESAQAEIFARYKDRVASHVFRMTGDHAAVDDLVQEVFISAFAGLPGFRGDAQLGTWLYRITTNKVRNWWDSTRRREARERESLPPAPVSVDPDESLDARDHRRMLYRALGQLPDILREAFVARAVEGMSLKEASDALSLPISTVSYRTRRAEALLCEALGIPQEEGS